MTEPLDPIGAIDQLVSDGRLLQSEVDIGLGYWRSELQEGVGLPNGERVLVTERDMHHLILDDRIRRKPHRISKMAESVFEIRTGQRGRRVAFCRWIEADREMVGYFVIDVDSSLRTAHLTDERGLRKLRRKGIVLWLQPQ